MIVSILIHFYLIIVFTCGLHLSILKDIEYIKPKTRKKISREYCAIDHLEMALSFLYQGKYFFFGIFIEFVTTILDKKIFT